MKREAEHEEPVGLESIRDEPGGDATSYARRRRQAGARAGRRCPGRGRLRAALISALKDLPANQSWLRFAGFCEREVESERQIAAFGQAHRIGP